MSSHEMAQQHPLEELFLPQARRQAGTQLPLARRTTARIHDIEWRSTELQLPMRCVGVAAPLEAPVVISGQHSDWAVMRYGDDPNYTQHAGHPMPFEQIEVFERMVDGGLDCFDDLAIVHQLPLGVRANQLHTIDLERVRAKYAPQAVARSRRYGAISGTILQMAALPLVGAAIAGFVAVGGMMLAAAPVLGAAMLLDPILFGLAHDPDTGNEAWVYLTHWDAYSD